MARMATTRRWGASEALRLSLLASLGLAYGACGATSQDPSDGSLAGSGASGPTKPLGKPAACSSPQVDAATGLTRCAEGYFHRPEPTECTPPAARAPAAGGAGNIARPEGLPVATGHDACNARVSNETDCNVFRNGFCRTVMPSPDCSGGCCFSGCSNDADCGAGQVCLCGSTRSPTGGECTAANCATDADCDTGYRCASHTDMCETDNVHFACQLARDTCSSDAQCSGQPCVPNGTDPLHRECFFGTCGRPFLIEQQARVAPVTNDEAWSRAPAKPRLDHLGAGEQAALAQHWTRLGQLEHASIAAFARFQLQLLALGAPPELVVACTAALGDETEHARLCFGLASAYTGHPVGPGPLDIDGSLDAISLAEVVDLVILEGCYGETRAALEAREAAEDASDPVIQETYRRIARDEERHAELAFRFVRWALERDPARIGPRVRRELEAPSSDSDPVGDVVEPCFYALLSASRRLSQQGLPS